MIPFRWKDDGGMQLKNDGMCCNLSICQAERMGSRSNIETGLIFSFVLFSPFKSSAESRGPRYN